MGQSGLEVITAAGLRSLAIVMIADLSLDAGARHLEPFWTVTMARPSSSQMPLRSRMPGVGLPPPASPSAAISDGVGWVVLAAPGLACLVERRPARCWRNGRGGAGHHQHAGLTRSDETGQGPNQGSLEGPLDGPPLDSVR